MATAYCMRCKTQREMEDFKVVLVRKHKVHQSTGEPYLDKRVMGYGKCPECGAKMARAYGKPPAGGLSDEEFLESLRRGEAAHNFTVGICPGCGKSKSIPKGDYLCAPCRSDMSNSG